MIWMQFVSDWAAVCAKPLNRSAATLAAFLWCGVTARAWMDADHLGMSQSRFVVVMTLVTIPLTLFVAFFFVYAVGLAWWALATVREARSRKTTFKTFIETPNYQIFLHARAPEMTDDDKPDA